MFATFGTVIAGFLASLTSSSIYNSFDFEIRICFTDARIRQQRHQCQQKLLAIIFRRGSIWEMNKVYKSYAELSAAFKSGELDRNKYYLMLDKGGTENSLSAHYDPNISDCENSILQEQAAAMFPGEHSIDTVFDALEIPCEWS